MKTEIERIQDGMTYLDPASDSAFEMIGSALSSADELAAKAAEAITPSNAKKYAEASLALASAAAVSIDSLLKIARLYQELARGLAEAKSRP